MRKLAIVAVIATLAGLLFAAPASADNSYCSTPGEYCEQDEGDDKICPAGEHVQVRLRYRSTEAVSGAGDPFVHGRELNVLYQDIHGATRSEKVTKPNTIYIPPGTGKRTVVGLHLRPGEKFLYAWGGATADWADFYPYYQTMQVTTNRRCVA